MFYVCFYIFLGSCAWMVLKRFGVLTLIGFLLSFLQSLLGWTTEWVPYLGDVQQWIVHSGYSLIS